MNKTRRTHQGCRQCTERRGTQGIQYQEHGQSTLKMHGDARPLYMRSRQACCELSVALCCTACKAAYNVCVCVCHGSVRYMLVRSNIMCPSLHSLRDHLHAAVLSSLHMSVSCAGRLPLWGALVLCRLFVPLRPDPALCGVYDHVLRAARALIEAFVFLDL